VSGRRAPQRHWSLIEPTDPASATARWSGSWGGSSTWSRSESPTARPATSATRGPSCGWCRLFSATTPRDWACSGRAAWRSRCA
jgi:hypothetical protein